MKETEFIKQLEKRSKEQEQLVSSTPTFFSGISIILGNHPWGIIIPLAVILTLLFRLLLGPSYYNFILRIFGGI